MQTNEPIDAEALLATPMPPVRWIIPDLLPAGLSLLAGASKTGKSWLCLWLCLQLARGGEVWGRSTEPQTVLYLCLEDTYARIQARLFHLTDDVVPSRLYFQTGCESIGEGLELQLEKFLRQHPDTALIVIDTLQKVRAADPSSGAYASDYQDMSALKSLASGAPSSQAGSRRSFSSDIRFQRPDGRGRYHLAAAASTHEYRGTTAGDRSGYGQPYAACAGRGLRVAAD